MFCLGMSEVHAVGIKNDKDAILALGMEMSNVRKMLEAYILIGNNVAYRDPSEKLKKRIAGYEELLNNLENDFQDIAVQESIKKSRVAWKPVKNALDTTLQEANEASMKESAIFIHGNIRSVIRELSNMKKYFLNKTDMGNKESLNAAIEIGASARRLSAHYMMKMWKLDDPTIEQHWNKGLKIYKDSLEILMQSPFYEDPKFKKILQKCSKSHVYFTKIGKKSRFSPALINKRTTIVFEDAKTMTQMILSKIDSGD